jgi:hypothetical protein
MCVRPVELEHYEENAKAKLSGIVCINPLNLKLIQMIFKNSARTAKKRQLFTITKINWLTLFKEIIAVYTENYTKHIDTKCRVTDC